MAKKKKDLFFDLSVKFEFGGDERQRFYTKLVQLLENGVSLDTALAQIEKISARKSKILPKLYKRWRNEVAEGINFGTCLAPYVPSSEAILLETGANSGKLVKSLQNSAESIENQSKVKKAIVGAAAYPCVLLCMLIAAMLLSSYKVIPTFEQIIPVDQWQGIAYNVAMAAKFIREDGIVLFVGLAVTIFTIVVSMPRWISPTRVYFDRFVPWSLYKMLQGSAFLLSVASMMSAGIKIDEVSLNRISKQSDPYLRQRIKGIQKYIASGENLGDALYNAGYEFPDAEIIGDLQIYARLRGFDQNLIRISQIWVDGLVEKVNVAMKIVNFVILVLIAVVIGCLIMSFYSVFQQIQGQNQ
ncbi:MAG: type II secretion system F family protein [Alphaproteobacteria bacterium]|nr:type II secretion system F family protein [Alphaproteobacteria bacterium]